MIVPARKIARNRCMVISSSPQPKNPPPSQASPPLPTSSQHHLCFQSEISRRSTRAQRVGPRLPDPLAAVVVVARECPRGHGQAHIGLGPGLTVDCAKGGQHPERTAWALILCPHVHPHHPPPPPPPTT